MDSMTYQRDTHINAQGCIVHSKEIELSKGPPTNQYMDNKMWCIHTMECYPAIKKNEIMNFASKWMELENIMLSELIQSQKDMNGMYSVVSGY